MPVPDRTHTAAPGGAGGGLPRALAFYLPQFHPIPENDRWWGPGFTEWRNVTRATPRFPGHYQPHLPGELGFYDLRVPEVRAAQAELARDHGISGFVYYHYWFHGKRLLERPFDEVLASGEPDFPFALCWSNEPWRREWDQTGDVLMPQRFSPEDDLAHIRWLADAFADPRYLTIDGRPLFLVYRPALLPDPIRTTDTWRAEAQRLGFPDLYLCWVESWGWPPGGPEAFGLDASVGFMPLDGKRIYPPAEGLRGHRVYDYHSAYEVELRREPPAWKRFPSVMASWDNSARRPSGARMYAGATPAAYERWLRRAVASVDGVREEENLLFLLAWNEWAEGNHLEPDRRYGRAYLEATRAVLAPTAPGTGGLSRSGLVTWLDPVPVLTPPGDGGRADRLRAAAAAVSLVTDLVDGPDRVVADLRPLDDAVGDQVRASGLRYLVLHPGDPQNAGGSPHRPPWMAADRPIEQPEVLRDLLARLDEVEGIGALLLLDELHRLVRPEIVLTALSRWALGVGGIVLVVAVPNSAHVDRGTSALLGVVDPDDRTPVCAPLTPRSFERMITASGWRDTVSADSEGIPLSRIPVGVLDELPDVLIGAVRTLASTADGGRTVDWIIRALTPIPLGIGGTPHPHPDVGAATGGGLTDRQRRDLAGYVSAVGAVVDERNRRASDHTTG